MHYSGIDGSLLRLLEGHNMLLQCPLVKQQVFKSNSAFNETKTNSEKHYNADRKKLLSFQLFLNMKIVLLKVK